MRIKLLICWKVLIILIVFALLAIWLFFSPRQASGKTILLTVNGEPIYLSEFKKKIDEKRQETFTYFSKKYNAEYGKNFWTSEFNGEIPVEYAKQLALEECINIKVQQILFKQKGVTDDISYVTFLKRLKGENERRSEAKAANQIIYGPEQFTEETYFYYLFSNMQTLVKEILENTEWKFGKESLLAYYEDYIANMDQETVPSFEDSLDWIKSQLVNEKYDELIDEMVSEAEVVIDTALYRKIELN